MPPGKKPLPLFELVNHQESGARREPQAVSVTAPVARPPVTDFQPREPKALPPEPRIARGTDGGPKHVLPALGGKPVVFGSTALWLAAAAGLLIVFLVWISGNVYGRKQAEHQFERSFGQVGGQIGGQVGGQVGGPVGGQVGEQPGGQPNAPSSPTSVNSGRQGKPAAPKSGIPQSSVQRTVQDPLATRPSVASEPGKEAVAIEAGQVLTAKGVGPDPRQSGWNYLLLGMLSREEAGLAIQFFAKNGVETIGVAVDPVDRKSPRGNTSPRFQLFAATGIPSSDFASKQLERDRLKTEVVRLGAIWKKDHKGSMSFSDAFWLKKD